MRQKKQQSNCEIVPKIEFLNLNSKHSQTATTNDKKKTNNSYNNVRKTHQQTSSYKWHCLNTAYRNVYNCWTLVDKWSQVTNVVHF